MFLFFHFQFLLLLIKKTFSKERGLQEKSKLRGVATPRRGPQNKNIFKGWESCLRRSGGVFIGVVGTSKETMST